MKLIQLYTRPAIIEPIIFHDGLNIIIGETDDTSAKNNGVGKSLCIEFINFALFKQLTDSRVSLIPDDVLPNDTEICLVLEVGREHFEIRRSIANSEQPTIIYNNLEVVFSKPEDATKFLEEKLFDQKVIHPSFRSMMGPIIRDERSEFKSIIGCYDTRKRIPDNYGPHLFLFGIDIDPYIQIKNLIRNLKKATEESSKIKENLKVSGWPKVSDARSHYNQLDKDVAKLHAAIEALEASAGYEIVKDDIIELETQIAGLRRKKEIIKRQLNKLKPFSQDTRLDRDLIEETYNFFKAGLGDLVVKQLDAVLAFKEKIESFQNVLIAQKRSSLLGQITELNTSLASKDASYAEKLQILDTTGGLSSIKQTYAAYQKKVEEIGTVSGALKRFDALERSKRSMKKDKATYLADLQDHIDGVDEVVKEVEGHILSMHEFIQGNRKASLKISTVTIDQVVDFDLRIDDDGGHSLEREKVFLYDMALLLSDKVGKRHPGILIHDNIFEVDQDTLFKSLEFIEEKASLSNKQYILTLNSDRITKADILQRIRAHMVATFTKEKRFLKRKYQEQR